MYFENPFIESIDNWVTVWVGELTEEELEAYLDEPGGAGDNDPISSFSKDLGRWYDHDFIWMEASNKLVPVEVLCISNGIESTSLIQEIKERTSELEVKCFLILWNAKALLNDCRSFANGKLRCIGSWEEEAPLTDGDF